MKCQIPGKNIRKIFQKSSAENLTQSSTCKPSSLISDLRCKTKRENLQIILSSGTSESETLYFNKIFSSIYRDTRYGAEHVRTRKAKVRTNSSV